jgi:hypothetical protein
VLNLASIFPIGKSIDAETCRSLFHPQLAACLAICLITQSAVLDLFRAREPMIN